MIRDSLEIDAMQIGAKALGTVPRRCERTGRLHPRAMTPLETLRVELDDPQYDRVRDVIRTAAKKAE